jgi:glycosyltransferase involved in cell wall biosynthesis
METRPINVFVFLGHGFGSNTWERRFSLGLIPGINDRLAYGYYRAACRDWSIEYSRDEDEGRFVKLMRLILRKMLGFDLIHAWRNKAHLLSADIVWTHTELEGLAVLLIFRAFGRGRRPKLLANCVWLFDLWPKLSRVRKALFRHLLKQADLVTTLSPENLKVAKRVVPNVRCECVLTGTIVENMKPPHIAPVHSPLRIASLGTDMHRDWKTLISAFGNIDGYQLRIGSSKVPLDLVANSKNVEVLAAVTADDAKRLYEWADFIVVPLKPNLHVSGITVIFESVLCAVPIVCSDTGGLEAYFSNAEICYVPPSDPLAMRAAVAELAKDDNRRFRMLTKAQERLISADLTTTGFAERNRKLSEQLFRSHTGEGIRASTITEIA